MLMLSRHMKLKGENSSSVARSLLRCLALQLGNVDWRGEVELASGASIQARVCEFNVWDYCLFGGQSRSKGCNFCTIISYAESVCLAVWCCTCCHSLAHAACFLFAKCRGIHAG